MPEELKNQDEGSKRQQNQGYASLQSQGSGTHPGIERYGDLTPVIGLGATRFDLTTVARVSRRAIKDDLPVVIDFRSDQGYTYWTLPRVAVAVKSKPASMVLIGSLMRVLGKPFESRADDRQEDGISRHQHWLYMECADHFSSEMPVR